MQGPTFSPKHAITATSVIWGCTLCILPASVVIAPFTENIGAIIMTAATLSTISVWASMWMSIASWTKWITSKEEVPEKLTNQVQHRIEELEDRLASLEIMDSYESKRAAREMSPALLENNSDEIAPLPNRPQHQTEL